MRVDIAYPEACLAIECDGYAFHSKRPDWERDRQRANALGRLGWRIIHATWAEQRNGFDSLIRDVAAALGVSPARRTRRIH